MRSSIRVFTATAIGICVGAASLASCGSSSTSADGKPVPRRIIILRHGEKQDSYALCNVGQERAQALQANFLGKGAPNSFFTTQTEPAAIFAITLHSLELISPTAQSWKLPVQTYSVVPSKGQTKDEELLQLNQRTQQAAKDVLTDPRWGDKTVIMAWEHDHIAKKSLEKAFPDQQVTLRQLLHLDKLANVPEDWPGSNFDYFWIVEYANAGSDVPTSFTSIKQDFPAPFQAVPNNAWNTPETLPPNSDCKAHTN